MSGNEGTQDPAVIQEMGLVGSLLWNDQKQVLRVAEAKSILGGWGAFTVPSHPVIMKALERVLERAPECDLLMLHGELAATGKLDAAGGADTMTALVNGVANPEHYGQHAKDLVRLSARRKALGLIQEINARVARGQDLNGELEALALSSMEACGLSNGTKVKTWEDVTHSPILSGDQIAQAACTAIDYVINPIIPRGYLTQIHGPPKGGKSTFMLYLSVAGSLGVWPEACPVMSPAIKVLYISWEDMLAILSKRTLSYVRGLGSDGIPPNLHMVEMPDLLLNLAGCAEILKQTIEAGKYDMVVLDTLSHAHAVDEDKASEIKLVMQTLARIAKDTKSAIVYVHHRRKNGEGVSMSERGRGSTAIGAAPVSIIDWGDRGDSDVTPVRVTGKLDYRASWEVEYIRVGDDAVRWEIREQDSSRKKRGGGQDGVLKALADLQASTLNNGDVPGKQIVEVMAHQGVSKPHVYRHLKTLIGCGTIASRVQGNSTFYRVTGV